jgi:hypothetical protein
MMPAPHPTRPLHTARRAPVAPPRTTEELVRQHLSAYPPGTELFVTARRIGQAIGRGMGGVVWALQALEAEGSITRIATSKGTHVTILAPLAPARRLLRLRRPRSHRRPSARHRTRPSGGIC